MMTMMMNMKWHCERCGHDWESRLKDGRKPKQCPGCHQTRWEEPAGRLRQGRTDGGRNPTSPAVQAVGDPLVVAKNEKRFIESLIAEPLARLKADEEREKHFGEVEEAQRAAGEPLMVTENDAELIADLLESPPEPAGALRAAVQRQKTGWGKKTKPATTVMSMSERLKALREKK